MYDCEVDFNIALDSLVVTVLLLIRGTISNNWRLMVEIEPKKTLELVVVMCNTVVIGYFRGEVKSLYYA